MSSHKSKELVREQDMYLALTVLVLGCYHIQYSFLSYVNVVPQISTMYRRNKSARIAGCYYYFLYLLIIIVNVIWLTLHKCNESLETHTCVLLESLENLHLCDYRKFWNYSNLHNDEFSPVCDVEDKS